VSGISVVIASYNQLSTLPLALESMASQTVLPVQVIIADDGSNDGTQQWIDELPVDAYPFPLSYVTGRHELYGLTVSENRGASHVRLGRILFTNADLIHNPLSVKEHDSMCPNVIGGGRVHEVRYPDSDNVELHHVKDFEKFLCDFNDSLSDMSNEQFVSQTSDSIYGVWGGNFSMDAWRFNCVGGFNESYNGKYGGEEADLIQRFKSRGGSIDWVYNSIAYHLGHRSKAYKESQDGIKKYKSENSR